ncbi:MAG: translation initiation factor IF-2, partial [Bacillota bacterium]
PPKEVQAQAAQQQQTRRTGGAGNRRDDRRRGEDRRRQEEIARFERRPGRQAVSAPPKNVKPITLEGPITVKDLAQKMAVGAGEVIKKLFLSLGVTATINAEIDVETAELVATEMGFPVEVNIEKTEAEEDIIYDAEMDPARLVTRPPVVTVMGHVDHGKTSLLDALRETRVAAGEAGGITQHIGAYQTELRGRKITFLDTPGHEAFTAMRARGAQVTDLVVLVVAADDGVMPQTVEAINHAKAAGVPIVVAINKIDKPNANPERVKTELTEYGLVAEQWGGDTVMVQVSAKNRTNLEQLLEMILLVSDVKEPKADPSMEARGTVIEAELDKGRGPVATVLIQTGTLMPGDSFLCGATWGRVRAMMDDKGRKLKKAGPSTPVQILGFTDVPSAGDVFRVMDEKEARANAEKRQTRRRAVEMEATSRLTLDDLSRRISEGEVKDLNIIVKADVQGSVEAVRGALEKLHNDEVRVNVIHGAVGAITESDVMLAVAGTGAIIIGFNVRPDVNARRAAEENKVDIRLYRVIYDAVDDITAALKGMLKPKMQEVVLGRVEVRQTFKVPKAGTIAGAFVLEGKITRNASVRVLRDNVVIFDGKIASLKRFKDDVREVAQGFECGLSIENFNDIKEGDQIEAYTVEEVKAE